MMMMMTAAQSAIVNKLSAQNSDEQNVLTETLSLLKKILLLRKFSRM